MLQNHNIFTILDTFSNSDDNLVKGTFIQMSYRRNCKYCGQGISLRKMPHSQWVAFDVSTETPHVCGKKSKENYSKTGNNSELPFGRNPINEYPQKDDRSHSSFPENEDLRCDANKFFNENALNWILNIIFVGFIIWLIFYNLKH